MDKLQNSKKLYPSRTRKYNTTIQNFATHINSLLVANFIFTKVHTREKREREPSFSLGYPLRKVRMGLGMERDYKNVCL